MERWLNGTIVTAFAGIALIVCLPFSLPVATAHVSGSHDPSLALIGAEIYTSPSDRPIRDGVIVISGNKIAAVGQAGAVKIPANAKTLNCKHLTITAGFQNSHAHFTEAKWDEAAKQPASKLSQQLAAMLTRYGVTTVVDAASALDNTTALRARIQSGQVPGPRILTAGGGLYPPDGTPYYLRETLPPSVLKIIAKYEEPATPKEAVQVVRFDIRGGADIIKLFTGSLITRQIVKPMPEAVAAAAVAEAHRENRLVFAHPSNTEGLEIAMNAGVDVLAHTTPAGGPWSQELIANMLAHHMSLIPTLKLWEYEAAKNGASPERQRQFAMKGAAQLKAFSDAGGQILFGTDVGYMLDYDPSEEYALMSRAGLTPMQILTSLTTAPAARFKEEGRRGRIARGMDADLVALDGDPQADVRNFARVHYTIRGGRVIYPLAANAN